MWRVFFMPYDYGIDVWHCSRRPAEGMDEAADRGVSSHNQSLTHGTGRMDRLKENRWRE